MTAEKTYFTDQQVYTASATALQAIEPSLTYVSGTPTAGAKEVQVVTGNVSTGATVNGAVICITGQTSSGKLWSVKDVAAGDNAGTTFSNAAISTCDDSKLSSSW